MLATIFQSVLYCYMLYKQDFTVKGYGSHQFATCQSWWVFLTKRVDITIKSKRGSSNSLDKQ